MAQVLFAADVVVVVVANVAAHKHEFDNPHIESKRLNTRLPI